MEIETRIPLAGAVSQTATRRQVMTETMKMLETLIQQLQIELGLHHQGWRFEQRIDHFPLIFFRFVTTGQIKQGRKRHVQTDENRREKQTTAPIDNCTTRTATLVDHLLQHLSQLGHHLRTNRKGQDPDNWSDVMRRPATTIWSEILINTDRN